MSDISTKLTTIAENQQAVYEAGQKSEYDRFWDEFQQNGNRINYQYGFAGDGWKPENFKPKYPITITGTRATNMFQSCNINGSEQIDMTDFCSKADFSGCTNATGLFGNARLKNITVDLSNATTISNAFLQGNGGGNTNIRIKISDKCKTVTAFSSSYEGQFPCEVFIFMEGSVIASSGMNMKAFTHLNKESLTSIINALSSTTSGLSVTLSKTAVNNAFEGGETGTEWNTLTGTKTNWTITLA